MRQSIPGRFILSSLLFFGTLLHEPVSAGVPRVLPVGEAPDDVRLGALKDLNGYFPFSPPRTRQEWEDRAANLRRQILVATGLWPMPRKTPLNPVIHGRVERGGFTVEKVYFESYPGHFVTGLLFRPAGESARGRRRHPGVLCPHGHGGRLQDHGAEKIRQLITAGRERFEGSGRYPKLSRCAQLARMGCVTFIYDMLGYADSVQISRSLAHRFRKQRPDFDTPRSWGFFGVQAELRLQSIMGVQIYNSIRALDFLASLPDVDPARLGVTGGSGGGTQTILLCAVDTRPVVAFPQGMVSTAMQGGCTCENCSLLRVGTGNVELAALFAPRPLGMTAANDWTKDMMTKGYPELQRLYELLGAPDRVLCKSLLHFPHNYNYVTRAIMYSWFNRHLGLELKKPVVEEDYRPLTAAEKTVWNDAHPAPAGGEVYERSLTRQIDVESRHQLVALTPTDAGSLAKYRELVGGALDTIIGRSLDDVGVIERDRTVKHDRGDYLIVTDLLAARSHGEKLPVISLYPRQPECNGKVTIWIDGSGKGSLFDTDGAPRPAVRRLLEAGTTVIGADLLQQGEFLAGGEPVTRARTVRNPREFAGYTFGFNHTLFAQRVHDILTLIAFAHAGDGVKEVHLVGVGGAGPLAAAASARAGTAIDRTAIDTAGFRFVNLTSYLDPRFLPGAVKYGDLPGILSLCAPRDLWIAGEGGTVPASVVATYGAAAARNRVRAVNIESAAVPDAIARWLIGRNTGSTRLRTSLSDPSTRGEKLAAPSVTVTWGKMTATLVDNRALPPVHAAGYNGLVEIRHDGGPSPFVPTYAGLNVEHVNNGLTYGDRDLVFEPRRHPMTLHRVDDRTYELHQAALPETGLQSCMRYTFSGEHDVDVVFDCIPRREHFPHDHLNVFWASYILQPRDQSIHFRGRRKGAAGERWIRGVTPSHGKLSTHRGASDNRTFDHDKDFPLTLVFNESDNEYTRPFYYGLYRGHVWIVMFREKDGVRLTQSPSGGGNGNPAWDFQWFIEKPKVGSLYRVVWRAVYKPWAGREDVLREYERFRAEVDG